MEPTYEGLQTGSAGARANASSRLIRGREVFSLVALSRTTVWRRVREGTFPAPVSLGPTRIAWREADIVAWVNAQRPVGADQ
jgi:prophage regulatory protein